MRHTAFLALCISLATIANAKAGLQPNFLIRSLHQEIDLRNHYTDVTINVELEALKDSDEVVLCGPWNLWSNAAHLLVATGEGANLQALKSWVDETEDLPQGVGCLNTQLPAELAKGKTQSLRIICGFTKLLIPYPKTIKQNEEQRMLFESNLLSPMPYASLEQKTTVRLPARSSIVSTTETSLKKNGDKLVYGPFKDVDPFSSKPLRLHYVDDRPYAHATKVVKEIQISLWGNIYVEEVYHLTNYGAQLQGSWSRLNYQKSQQKNSNVLKEVVAVLPSLSHSLYLKDEIGNISTSHVRMSDSNVVSLLKPRFPLQKGWKTQFTFGYSVPLKGSLFKKKNGVFQLLTKFGPSVQAVTVDDLEVRVVLPEGSSKITYQFPFTVGSDFEKKFWYFDTIGRPVLVLKLMNAVPRHNSKLTVDFAADSSALWRKPIYFVFLVSMLFGICMLYNRFELGISSTGQGQNSAALWDSEDTDALETVLDDRQAILENVRGAISAAYATGTSTKPSEILADARKRLENSSKKLESLSDLVESSNPNAWPLLQTVITKEKDLMDRALQQLSTALTNLDRGKSKKGRKPSSEDKAINDLSAELSTRIDELLSAL